MKLKVLSLVILFFGLTSCLKNQADGVQVLDVAKYEKKMVQPDVQLVDVRTPEEYDEGFIENAILIPNETINEAPTELPDKDAVILVYCRSGNRSRQAANKLVDLGYTNIYDFGGIIDWPYEIVD